MSIFKCKMCGGTIEFENGASVGVCDSCGTKQTLPRLDDERKANLYDRANHFRRNNEYDKAMSIYEQILNEDNTDAESYWSLVLCKYGIEYVEDPSTHTRIPTVNRAQFTSVFADEDYKSALQYADIYQRSIYEEEAKAIDDIQKGILEISSREDPFDVFICYKETDANGRRTQDSVLANDLYHQLVQEGLKVFFSRITLEDKLGTAFEPYIFAALNSAKVMVVLGTKPEYFSAVWVKNEWSRYLSIVKQSGGKKILIPAYRDMDPYDLPEEFSHLQAQDMSKLGFMQDLIRGIKKIISVDETKTTVKETVVNAVNANVVPLLKRASMFLEDGDWNKADDFCEQVLNIEPENPDAYMGKLMAELKVSRLDDLANCEEPFDWSNNYQKAMRFGDDDTVNYLKDTIAYIKQRNETARVTKIYNKAIDTMKSAKSESEFKEAAAIFGSISGCMDADVLAEQCMEKAEICRKDKIYASALSQMTGFLISGYETAIELLGTISGWKDADEQINICHKKIEDIKKEREIRAEQERIAAEKAAKKAKKEIAIVIPIFVAIFVFVVLLITVIIPTQKYNDAVELYNSGKYEEAIEAFTAMDGYKDSASMIDEIRPKYYKQLISDAHKGSSVYIGSYEQDNDITNGKEDIEWIVLAVDGNKALIISKYALDCQPYNSTNTDTTWEKCSLRNWLNGTFYNAAFDADHQEMIISSTVSADKNPNYSTSPGNNTTDKVFLLSIPEVIKYFGMGSASQCQGTAYCYAQGAYREENNSNCRWRLRSPGGDSDHATFVSLDGSVYYNGGDVNYAGEAIRPAMWITIEP